MRITENIIKKFHPHPLGFLGFYIFGIIFVVIGVVFFKEAIVFGFLVFCLGEILRQAETFYILDTGVARGYHLFGTSRKFAEYKNIQNIEVNQSLLEHIIGIGSVKFDTAGGDTVEVAFHGVRNPYNIEKIVREKMAEK